MARSFLFVSFLQFEKRNKTENGCIGSNSPLFIPSFSLFLCVLLSSSFPRWAISTAPRVNFDIICITKIYNKCHDCHHDFY